MSTYGESPQQDRRTLSDAPGQTAGHYVKKPEPIITGISQAEGIAKFAHRVTYEDLTPDRRERLKVSVLDSLGCAITALGCPRSWRVWNRQNSSAVRTLDAL